MISLEVIAYLNSDSVLSDLIGVTGSDTKIYPLQVPQGAEQPYIVFNVPSDGGLEENLKEISLSFDCIADDYITAENIRNRVSVLLDRQDTIGKYITSTDYKYFWSKRVGGAEFEEPNLDLFHRASIFDFKYAILPEIPVGDYLLTEDGQKILTEDGQGILLEP